MMKSKVISFLLIVLLLSVVSLSFIPLGSATELFNADFEDGTIVPPFNYEYDPLNILSVQETNTPHSNYSMIVELTALGDEAYARKDFTATNRLFLRYYVMFTTAPSNGKYIQLGQVRGSYMQAAPRIENVSGTLKWGLVTRVNGSTVASYSSQQTKPSPNTWYCVEVESDLSSADDTADGNYRMWVNGSELTDIAQLNVDTDGTLNTFIRLGSYHNEAIPNNVHIECAIVADTGPIGIEEDE